MTTPLRLLRPTEDDFALARAVLKLPKSTRPAMLEACNTLAQSTDWLDVRLASEMRNVLWADRASELLPQARDLAERLARNQVPETRLATAAELDEAVPHFAGLQQGEVRQRWLDRQEPVDRWLFRAIFPTLAFGAAVVMALIWGAL